MTVLYHLKRHEEELHKKIPDDVEKVVKQKKIHLLTTTARAVGCVWLKDAAMSIAIMDFSEAH